MGGSEDTGWRNPDPDVVPTGAEQMMSVGTTLSTHDEGENKMTATGNELVTLNQLKLYGGGILK